jgi:hypothetical protein
MGRAEGRGARPTWEGVGGKGGETCALCAKQIDTFSFFLRGDGGMHRDRGAYSLRHLHKISAASYISSRASTRCPCILRS